MDCPPHTLGHGMDSQCLACAWCVDANADKYENFLPSSSQMMHPMVHFTWLLPVGDNCQISWRLKKNFVARPDSCAHNQLHHNQRGIPLRFIGWRDTKILFNFESAWKSGLLAQNEKTKTKTGPHIS